MTKTYDVYLFEGAFSPGETIGKGVTNWFLKRLPRTLSKNEQAVAYCREGTKDYWITHEGLAPL